MAINCGTMDFTGGPYLAKVGAAGAVNLRASHTMACRVRHTTTSTTFAGMIMGYQDASLGINAGSGSFIVRWDSDPATTIDFYRYDGAAATNDARSTGAYGSTTAWVHLCLVYDAAGAIIRSYVNGVAATTVASATTFAANTTNVRLVFGRHPADFADVVFAGRALSASDVQLLHARRFNASGLGDTIAWFPAHQGTLAGAQEDWGGLNNDLSLQDSGSPNPALSSTSVPVPWGTPRPRPYIYIVPPPDVDFAGTVTSPTAVTGSTAIKNQFSGTAASPSSSSGTLQVRKFFTATACSSTTSCAGTLAVRKLFSTNVATSPTACIGTLQSRKVFSGACASPTSCTGTLTLFGIVAFAGTATSPTACTASGNVRKPVTSGVATSPTAAAASFNVRKPSSAAVTSPSACTGSLRVRTFFSGVVTTPTACQGMQSGGTVVSPIGPEDPRNTQNRRAFALNQFRRRGRY